MLKNKVGRILLWLMILALTFCSCTSQPPETTALPETSAESQAEYQGDGSSGTEATEPAPTEEYQGDGSSGTKPTEPAPTEPPVTEPETSEPAPTEPPPTEPPVEEDPFDPESLRISESAALYDLSALLPADLIAAQAFLCGEERIGIVSAAGHSKDITVNVHYLDLKTGRLESPYEPLILDRTVPGTYPLVTLLSADPLLLYAPAENKLVYFETRQIVVLAADDPPADVIGTETGLYAVDEMGLVSRIGADGARERVTMLPGLYDHFRFAASPEGAIRISCRRMMDAGEALLEYRPEEDALSGQDRTAGNDWRCFAEGRAARLKDGVLEVAEEETGLLYASPDVLSLLGTTKERILISPSALSGDSLVFLNRKSEKSSVCRLYLWKYREGEPSAMPQEPEAPIDPWGASEDERAIAQIVSELRGTLRVHIFYGQVVPKSPSLFKSEVTTDVSVSRMLLEGLREALLTYPEEILARLQADKNFTSKIIFCATGTVTYVSGEIYGGWCGNDTDSETGEAICSVTVGYLPDGGLSWYRGSWYHEITHLIDIYLLMYGFLSDTAWEELNPAGFVSSREEEMITRWTIRDEEAAWNPDVVYFGSPYGKTGPGEDRAELMRVLLNAPWDETTLWELLPSSHVRAKYERYFDILHEAFEDVDREETPWERLYKELLQRYGIS